MQALAERVAPDARPVEIEDGLLAGGLAGRELCWVLREELEASVARGKG